MEKNNQPYDSEVKELSEILNRKNLQKRREKDKGISKKREKRKGIYKIFKKHKWLFIIFAALFIIAVIIVIIFFLRKKKNSEIEETEEKVKNIEEEVKELISSYSPKEKKFLKKPITIIFGIISITLVFTMLMHIFFSEKR